MKQTATSCQPIRTSGAERRSDLSRSIRLGIVDETDFQLEGSPTQQVWENRLHREGYRLTSARRAVLRALSEVACPLSAGELHRRARAHHAHLGLVTVYRTLDMLDRLGLVRRVHTDGACRGYAARSPGHHHTITCERCERAAEFEGDEVCLPMVEVEARTGYVVREHWLQLVGLCPDCQEEAGHDETATSHTC